MSSSIEEKGSKAPGRAAGLKAEVTSYRVLQGIFLELEEMLPSRDEAITTRVRASEKKLIAASADAFGLSLSDYMRTAALSVGHTARIGTFANILSVLLSYFDALPGQAQRLILEEAGAITLSNSEVSNREPPTDEAPPPELLAEKTTEDAPGASAAGGSPSSMQKLRLFASKLRESAAFDAQDMREELSHLPAEKRRILRFHLERAKRSSETMRDAA